MLKTENINYKRVKLRQNYSVKKAGVLLFIFCLGRVFVLRLLFFSV
jgi:hypothetical protein